MSLTMLYLGIPPGTLLTMPLLQFVKLLPSLLPVGLSKLTQWNQSTGKPFATLTIPIPFTSVGRFDGVRQWVKTYIKKNLDH